VAQGHPGGQYKSRLTNGGPEFETSPRWYVDILGFTPDTFQKSPPYSFAILRQDGAEIMQLRSIAASRE
jgi:hypothetical protein